MNNRYLFSIIIPVYNAEKYLASCFDSLLKQTYKDEYEVIVIDDGSTDNSLNVINDYKSKFINFVAISRENKGSLLTRVEAAKQVTGKYILFLDADDYLPEDCLEIYNRELQESEYDIVRGNYTIFSNDSTEFLSEFPNKNIINKADIKEQFYKRLLTEKVFNSACRQIIKKDCISFEDINNSRIHMGDDIEFNLACYKNANTIKLIPDNVYYYKRNDKSLTKDFSDDRLQKNIEDMIVVYDTIIRDVELLNDTDLLKLAYSSYLKIINGYCYMLVKNSNNDNIISEAIDEIINNNKTAKAKELLRYKDIPFKKTRFLLYLIMNKKKKIYKCMLKFLAKLGMN